MLEEGTTHLLHTPLHYAQKLALHDLLVHAMQKAVDQNEPLQYQAALIDQPHCVHWA